MRQFFLVFATSVIAAPQALAADNPTKVFDERILPIFKSPNPSSCVQCHLASVDLKDYILPSAEKTFRSLRDQGLIDLENPEKSKILRLIAMSETDRKTPAIHAAKRKAEYDAFAAWIKSCAGDAALRSAPKLDAADQAKPPAANEVIRHARKDEMLASFERTVWAMRFRCMNCHTEGTPQNDKLRREYGERVSWFKKSGPAATMEYLISSKLIDIADPEKSLLLQKPLGKVKHEGGIKFAIGDQGHKAFREWIEDVAKIKGGKYVKAADLPKSPTSPLTFGTEAWLKLTDTPPAWGDKLVQVDVYAWDDGAKTWESKPIATSDRKVWGKGKLWQHTMTLLAEPGSTRAKDFGGRPVLPAGRYQLKVYVDANDRLANDWRAKLGEEEYVGQTEFTAQWKEGYGQMSVVDARKVRK